MASGMAVLVAAPEPPPLEDVTRLLARFLGGNLLDARQKARRGWGFLAEELAPAEADRLAAFAREAGIPVKILPMDRVVFPPAPSAIHHLRADPAALLYIPGSEPVERSCPWDRVKLLAAAPLKETQTVTKTVREGPSNTQHMIGFGVTMLTGIPTGMGKSQTVKKTVRTTDLSLHMDVFLEEPEGLRRLHVDGDKFNYDVLGPARKPDALGNFRLLLQSLDQAAGPAARNRGVRGLLTPGQPLAALGYEIPADYEQELRWLLTLQRI